jgi:shikimate dehydrogenase
VSKFGLIGKNIGYSFSKSFFTEKFKGENLPHSYENFDIDSIGTLRKIISKNKGLKGLNVTIPYKEEVISLLDELDEKAKHIGAVNTVKISENKLKGYNTDCYGFQKSLEEYLPLQKKTALILGTGGASKAVAYTLKNLGFEYRFVSRGNKPGALKYTSLGKSDIKKYLLIVNCTPLGTFPNIKDCPPIPYQFLTEAHLLFDLIYNPSETKFLKRGKSQGAETSNGLKMLQFQAEKAWEIWNS